MKKPNDELSITLQETDDPEPNPTDWFSNKDWLTRENAFAGIILFMLADRIGWFTTHQFPLPFEFLRKAGRTTAEDLLGTAWLYPVLYHFFFALIGTFIIMFVLTLTMRPAREIVLLTAKIVVQIVITSVKFRMWRADRVGIRANDDREDALFFVKAKVPIKGLTCAERKDIREVIAAA